MRAATTARQACTVADIRGLGELSIGICQRRWSTASARDCTSGVKPLSVYSSGDCDSTTR